MIALDVRWASGDDHRPVRDHRTNACVAFYGRHHAFAQLKRSIPKLEPEQWALYTHAVLATRDGAAAGYALVDLAFAVEAPGSDLEKINADAVQPIAIIKEIQVLDSEAEETARIRRALLDFVIAEGRACGVRAFYVDRVYASDRARMSTLDDLGFKISDTFHVMKRDVTP